MTVLLLLTLAAALYAASLRNYLLFHGLVETFSVAVAVSVFAVTWACRDVLDNHFFLLLGISSLFVGVVDMFHMLAYKGMGVFDPATANSATQLWLLARYLQALSLLLATFFVGRRLKILTTATLYGAYVAVGFAAIFYLHVFPVAYSETSGLTEFKKISEYAIILVLLLAGYRLYRRRGEFHPAVYRLLLAALGMTVLAEFAFTLYVSVFGLPNFIGHLAKIAAFALFLVAVVSTGVSRPYAVIFQRLQQRETALTEAKEELEDRVRARTLDLEQTVEELRYQSTQRQHAEEELRQSQRMEAIGRLAGGVAHDFNNLLTVIIGHADLLLTEVEPGSESRGDVEGIRASADRAAALTRQLLAFSRRQALQPHVFNLDVVAQSMADLLKRLLGENIDLVFREDSALWPVEADPGQIEQVIMNLAINARDAMPEGGKLTLETANVELGPDYVATHSEAEPGPHVMLAVSDTGTGIDPEILPHIFEPFFTTKETAKGTGLGLSTVYGIVKQSGGNIWVYSEPGQGTTFKLYFPRAEGPVAWTPEGTPLQRGRVDGGKETILVVEDEPAVRALTVRVLEAAGYTVLQEGDPAQALELFDEYGRLVHLLLTDVVLPGMSGRTLADTITARQGVSPKVLFMSGYTQNAIVHEGRLDVGVDFLEKPFTPDGLLRKIREVLDRPQDRQLEMDV